MKSLGLHYAKDDLRTVFAVTGGLPAYVQYFDNGESIDTNIINLFFSVSGALFEETQHILHRDMKNITGANAILSGLATHTTWSFYKLAKLKAAPLHLV